MQSNEPEPLRSIEEPPPDDEQPPPPRITVRINQISPIAGALAGGITVTLTGRGFQPDAEVFFGDSPSPEVIIESAIRAQAKLPAASQTGSVDVSLFNPDGSSATLPGGFTYVVTGTGAQAEVLGVSPLAVIEDTESEVTIRGRNLVEAYTNGMLALRGPTRAQVSVSNHTSSRDEATGIEELTFTLRVTAAPPLEPLERMAIQVLASRRPGAAGDGVFESSRQMFTVLPRSRPVALAYSANLDPGRPNVVVVAGRNLEGCTLDLGDGAAVHLQRSDDRFVAGIVTLPEGTATMASPQLSVRDAGGEEVAQYAMWIVPDASPAAAAPAGDASASAAAEPAESDINLMLTPVPGQQMLAPTEQDSTVFNLNSASSSSLFFDWFNFEITILDLTIVLPIVHEVHLIPFFDGVSADELSDSPVLAQVGRLLRLRGVGLLVALHVDVIIHIRVVLIIGFRFEIWGFGLFNEFPEFGWAIGSIVISIRIEIEIIFILAFLLAAVLPQGRLRVIFAFNLIAELDFTISSDGFRLRFGSDFNVNYRRIGPSLNNLLPCGGRFQLASENGQTVFPDAFGGHQSFYFPRAEGECCVPWDFDLQLVRTDPDGFQETVQTSFRADYCLNAAPSPQLGQIIITSENPAPTGFPPTLVMEVEQLALLRALSVPVDASGNPTGEPPQDVRDLGYDVEFFLESPVEVVLDPGSLTQGNAFAIQPGDNVIHARLIPRAAETPRLALWPGSVLGFAIAGPLAEGREPGIIAGTLPVVVKGRITVTPTLIYRVEQGRTSVKVEAPSLFQLNNIPVREVERSEPFNMNPRRYVLGLKINADPGTQAANLKFRVKTVRMEVLPLNTTTPQSEAPLDIQELTDSGIRFDDDRRTSTDVGRFFTGKLSQEAQQFTLRVDPNVGEPVEVLDRSGNDGLILIPNHKEAPGSPRKLVPPGQNVAGRHVLLTIELEITSSDVKVVVTQSTIRLVVTNEETFEEYLRVLVETDSLVTASPRLSGFAASFEARLSKGHSDTLLNGQGALLWEEACAEVQTSLLDDRPLYWTRLRCTAVLRAYFKRRSVPDAERERLIKQFEWPSRGLDADGVIRFADPQAAGSRRAIITGFDPFFLPPQPDRSNPSGVSALSLNKKALNPYKALFIKRDVATQGTWRGAYGADGYNVINDAVNYPSYAQVTPAGQSSHTWAPSTAEARALQKASSADRLAACWFGAQFTVEVNITDGKAHQVALYVLDWDGNNGRSQTIEVLDAATNDVLDSRSVSAFSEGQYLVWEISGHVKFRVTNNAGPALNAVVSGIFFSTPQTNTGVFVRTAIFPVRYEDFNKNMVENSVRPTLGSIVMLMTCSQGLDGFYYVDRFPARRRGNKKFNPQDPNDPQAGPPLIDNNRALERDSVVPPSLASGDEYLESTLPYELEIKSDPATRQLPAPQPGPPFAQNFFFFLNQSYWILGSRATTTVPGERRLDPQDINDDASFNKKERPRAGATAYEGSGGNYLSNEIFYRTALTRTREVPSLASGHFHIPPLRTSPRSLGPGLVHSVRTAAERFLKHLFRMRKSGDITFPRTNVNTMSASVTLTATNITNETISVFTVDVAPPFAVQWPGPTPIPLSPGSSLPLPFTFRPTTPGDHTQTVKLRDSNGELLLLATLVGEAVPTYSVTGQVMVSGMPLQGVQVTLTGSRTASVTTGKDGRYSFTNLDAGGDYTVTPSKANYTFTPPSRSFSGLAVNQTADFTATLNRHRIRGSVRTASGVPIPNATVTLFGSVTDTRTTDTTGEYLFTDLPAGGDYVVTVNRTNYAFTLVTQVFKQLAADADLDFTGTLVSYTVSGRVTDGVAGLGGVTVDLSGSQTATATTDASGNYSFIVPAEGNYTVTPSRTHYTFTPPSLSLNNLEGDQTADFVATLNRYSISGRVTREDGSALAGATIALTGTQTATTVSDANGAYSFGNLPARGSYTVTVSKANYSFAQSGRTFNDLASTQTADFTGALLNYTVSGRVTSGISAVSGVTVTLSGSQPATVTTDASGNYSFTVKAEGNYTVTPSKQHYTFTPPTATFNNLSGNQTTNFTATLNSHAISGHVTNAAGTPLAGVAVTLSGSQPGTATTDAAGSFSFPNLPAGGSYTVTPSRANYTFAPASLSFNNLGANQPANFTGALVRYTVSGKVTLDGVGLGGVNVTLSGSETATATTDAAGSYSFTVTAEGSYTVSPSKTNYTFSPPSGTFSNLGANQTADFSATLNRHRISGRVATANGTGIAGVVVMLSGSQSTTTTTDAFGNYSFANLPAGGTYTVTPSRSNYSFTPASRTFDNLIADAAFDFTGALVSYRISGRITDGSDGLGGVTVTLSGSQSSSATTDASGNYSFTVMAEGNYTVTPSKQHYTFSPQLISFNTLSGNQSADFSATLNQHTISGRITTAGVALPNVTLSLSGSQSGTATTDASGNYSFADLPAGGSYTVTAARANYAFTPASKSFSDLGANQTADFTGGLVSYRISGRVISGDAGLAGVTINLSGSQTATATTDASGNYSFTVPAEGSYTVTASKTHYTFAPPSLSFNNLGGDQAADFAATLNRHTISGRVADANNKGIAGITVALSGTQPRTATTDTAGNYSFTNLPAGGSYTVTASKANYTFTPPSQSFSDLASGQTANFAATLVSYRISGRVTENGTGLGGVTVTLSGSQSATATTDVGGNYSFTVPAEGSYTVTPSKTNYTFSPPSVTFSNLGANQSADFSAALNRHTISGSITTADGGAIPNVTVSLAGSPSATATTDASGNYSFANLPAGGSYTVTPSRANYTFTPESLSFSGLSSNQAADFRAALVRYTVSGKVTLGGSGFGGVTIILSGSETATATTDAAGTYSFTVMAEGSYTVTPSKQHYTFTPQPVIFNNLGANQIADFAATLNRHTISGRVTGRGIGLGDVTVYLSGSQTGNVITDATGAYSFVDLPAGGDYTVTPSRANYTFSPASHSFGDLGGSQTADFTGTPVSYTVSGRITSGGSGLAGVTINLGGSQDATAVTGVSGDYSFTVTAEGSYTVTPSEPHYTFTPPGASFSNLGADQRADFSATLNHHTISGHITRADGTGIAGVAVTLSGTQTGTTTTDAAGNYSFTDLPAGGGYTVTAARTNYTFTPAISFSDLIANQTADFTGRPVSYTISGRVVSGGIGLADITVTLTGSETATATTDASGNYSFAVPAEGSYTVSPSEHYAFTPLSATFDSLAANKAADFGAPPNRHRISGRLTNPTGDALPNVLLSLTGSQSRTTRTDEAGNYSFVVLPEGGNYTVTPRLFGYSFTPLSSTFNGLSADQARDFAAGPVGGVRINLALPSDGPVFSVSTMYRLGRVPGAVINGDLRVIDWHDATPDGSPAWLEVSFAGLKTISEVHVFNIQENSAAIAELAEATTFTQHGLQDFGVEYWTGADWQSVPGGTVTNNSRVWVKIAFPPLTTTKIRLVVRRALGG